MSAEDTSTQPRQKRITKKKVIFGFESDGSYAIEDDLDHFVPNREHHVVGSIVQIVFQKQKLDAKILLIGGDADEKDDIIKKWIEEGEKRSDKSNLEDPVLPVVIANKPKPTQSTSKATQPPTKSCTANAAVAANGIQDLQDLHDQHQPGTPTDNNNRNKKTRKEDTEEARQRQERVEKPVENADESSEAEEDGKAKKVWKSPFERPGKDLDIIFNGIPRYLPKSAMTIAKEDVFKNPEALARFMIKSYYSEKERKQMSANGQRARYSADEIVFSAIRCFITKVKYPGCTLQQSLPFIFNSINGSTKRRDGYRCGKYKASRRRKPGEPKLKPGPKKKRVENVETTEENQTPPQASDENWTPPVHGNTNPGDTVGRHHGTPLSVNKVFPSNHQTQPHDISQQQNSPSLSGPQSQPQYPGVSHPSADAHMHPSYHTSAPFSSSHLQTPMPNGHLRTPNYTPTYHTLQPGPNPAQFNPSSRSGGTYFGPTAMPWMRPTDFHESY